MVQVEQRPGASPTLPLTPSREDLIRTRTHSSLREVTAHWKRIFGRNAVLLDPSTLRPSGVTELVRPRTSNEAASYLRFVFNVANEGEPLKDPYLRLRHLESPTGSLTHFAFAWGRSTGTRKFDITAHDFFWSNEDGVIKSTPKLPIHSYAISDTNRLPQEIDFDGPVDLPQSRVSGLRGFLETRDMSTQKQFISDLVAVIHPEGKRISFSST